MNLYRLPEIMIFEWFSLFPNLLLALLPFRRQLRFKLRTTCLFALFLYILMVISCVLSLLSLSAAGFLTVLFVILYLAFYSISLRLSPVRLLFILLTILNYASFVSILLCHLAYHRYGASVRYSLPFTLILIGIYGVTYPPLLFFMFKMVAPIVNGSAENKFWHYLWMVPATFCLAYYYTLFSNGGAIVYSALPRNVVFAVFYNLGALFVTFLVLRLVEVSNTSLMLKAENYQLNMQSLQYQNLKYRIDEARRAKHDLRQNLAVISSYVKDGNYEGLQQYISQYLEKLPSDATVHYCDDYVLNALLVYYETMANDLHIRFDVTLETTVTDIIDSTDAAILFGNLLENAVEACRRQTNEKPFIHLHLKAQHELLAVTLENSYTGEIHRSGEDFISSKTGRTGIGISSIREITHRYSGTIQFEFGNGQFCVSLLLNRKEEKSGSYRTQ